MVEDIFSTSSNPLWTIVGGIVLPLAMAYYSYYFFFSTRNPAGDDTKDGMTLAIPWAPGQTPLLGHALAYRQNPSQFLVDTCQKIGPIFQLNLAGKHMIVIAAGPQTLPQQQVAKAPERIMSARQAVADIGFEEMLGKLNVRQGTDLHKGIVKGIWNTNRNSTTSSGPTEQFRQWKCGIQRAMQIEVALVKCRRHPNNKTRRQSQPAAVDFFHLMRRVMLRVTIDQMIGTTFLSSTDDIDSDSDMDDPFLDDFMHFQDHLEDVTAKAVVLPRWIALPFLLRPVRYQRERLQVQIEQRLQAMLSLSLSLSSSKEPSSNNNNKDDEIFLGFWLSQMYPKYPLSEIAEYIVGLLFAAHKNPAIGAAQSYLMMWEHCSSKDIDEIRKDAQQLLSMATEKDDKDSNDDKKSGDDVMFWNRRDTALKRLCLETLRLTAHSIGGVRTVQEDFLLEIPDSITGKNSNSRTNNTTGKKLHYLLPKGASIGLTHIAPSLNPELWGPNAQNFQLKAFDMTQHYQDEYKFTTFSHGIHKCPGQQLALVMLQCTVAILLQDYDVTFPTTPLPPISFERATLAQREGPVLVTIRPKTTVTTHT